MLLSSHSIKLVRGIIRLQKIIFLGKSISISYSNKLAIGKGISIGNYTSLDCLGKIGLTIGNGSSIGHFCLIKVSGNWSNLGKGIHIGSNVGIGDFSHIGGAGEVTIGNDTITGSYLSIHPENHEFSDLDMNIREQGVSREGIKVGSNCLLGAKVTLLDGCSIGDGCVVAAGAVVRGDFPANCIIGGVPAKIIIYRG